MSFYYCINYPPAALFIMHKNITQQSLVFVLTTEFDHRIVSDKCAWHHSLCPPQSAKFHHCVYWLATHMAMHIVL